MPAGIHQLPAKPDHTDTKADHHQIGERKEKGFDFVGDENEQNVETEVITLANTDRGTKKDEPCHQHDGHPARSR